MELPQQKAGSREQRSCYSFINEEAKAVSTRTTSKTWSWWCSGTLVQGHWLNVFGKETTQAVSKFAKSSNVVAEGPADVTVDLLDVGFHRPAVIVRHC